MPAFIATAMALALSLSTMQAQDDGGASASPGQASIGRATFSADDAGRFRTQVKLNGKGPYWFLIDTAATASMLSPPVAVDLQLTPGASTQVTGGIGSEARRSVSIDTYRSGLFVRHNETMTLLPGLSSDGIIGMNAFGSQRIEFDLEANEMKVGAAGVAPEGFVATQGTLQHGILIVDVVIDGVRAKAVIDTGAPYNIGNPQLQAALGLKPGDPRLLASETLVDSFGQQRPASKSTLGKITIGAVVFSKPTIRFAEMPVLRALDLDGGPALILGIDQLSHLEAMAIDYPRAELQLRP